jgi:hypothetical protein
MQKVNVYSVRDAKAEVYNQPYCLKNHALAIRSFQEHCENPQTEWHKYPEDFTLFQIGEYHTETGKLTPLDSPVQIAQAVDFNKAE